MSFSGELKIEGHVARRIPENNLNSLEKMDMEGWDKVPEKHEIEQTPKTAKTGGKPRRATGSSSKKMAAPKKQKEVLMAIDDDIHMTYQCHLSHRER